MTWQGQIFNFMGDVLDAPHTATHPPRKSDHVPWPQVYVKVTKELRGEPSRIGYIWFAIPRIIEGGGYKGRFRIFYCSALCEDREDTPATFLEKYKFHDLHCFILPFRMWQFRIEFFIDWKPQLIKVLRCPIFAPLLPKATGMQYAFNC